MAFALLWIETLALVFIFIAFLYGLSSPLNRRFLRILIRVVAFLIPFLLGGAFTVFAWYLRNNNLDVGWIFSYSLSWLIGMLVGFALLRTFARKAHGQEESCSSWRLMTMAGAFGIVLSLCLLTFMKMDADARARLDAAQARALALAPSWNRDIVPLSVENRSPITGLWQRSLLMEEAVTLYSLSFDLSTDRLYGGGVDITAETLPYYVIPYRALMSKYDLAFFEKAYQICKYLSCPLLF